MKTNILIVGAGKGGTALIELFSKNDSVQILGVADCNHEAEGMKLAQSLGIPVSTDYKTFLDNKELHEIINVTGSEAIQKELIAGVPAGIEVIGGHSAKFMWELVETYKKSKEFNELILNLSPYAIFTVDTNRCVTGWNEKAREVVGYAAEEVMGKSCFVFSEFPCKEKCGLYSDDMSKPINKKECTLKRKDGAFRIILKNVDLLRDNQGNCIGGVEIFEDITERKQLEINLQLSRQNLIETLNFLPDATFVIDKEGTVKVWNRAMEELTGVPAKDMLGKGNFEYAIPFYGERRLILIDLIFRPNEEVERKYAVIKREGKLLMADTSVTIHSTGKNLYVSAAATALFDSDGNIIGAIETIRDITGRKKMEDALRESEEKYRAFFETAQEGIFIISLDDRLLDCNNAALKLMGYESKEEAMKMPVADFYADKDNKERHTNLVLQQEFIQDYPVDLRKKDGSVIHTLITSTLRKDKEGRVIGFQGTIHDITESMEAQRDLQASHERFQAVLDSLDALIYVADLNTHEVLFTNKYGVERWGAAVGRLCWQTFHKGQTGPCHFCDNSQLLDAHDNAVGVLVREFRNADNRRWYEIRDEAIHWTDGRLVRMHVAVDITGRKQAEEQLKDKISELERFHKVIVGRELKMIELKEKILEMESRLDKK